MPSTVIQAFQYDPATFVLRVTFTSGLIYDYKNVPPETYERMRQAFSKGKFLNEEIKGRYPFEKVS